MKLSDNKAKLSFSNGSPDVDLPVYQGNIGPDVGDAIVYNQKAGKADRDGSKHPTVKPIALLRNLIRHVTPPGGVVLDPFAGSGTTAVAAREEGFDCILMEMEDEYVEFLKGRLKVNENDTLSTNSRCTEGLFDSELKMLLG